MDKILDLLENNELTIKEIISFLSDCPENDIILMLNTLFLENKIIKIKKNQQIFFLLNKKGLEISYNKNCIDDISNTTIKSSSQKISQMARKFRSSRYKVERDVIEKGIRFSLKISKKENTQYLLFISNDNMFEDLDVFNTILTIDSAIRIVVNDEKIKQKISQMFDTFIKMNYSIDNGYIDFRKKYSFYILTFEEFFIKTTWKTLIK